MKKIISTENAPKAVGPYSQAVQYGDLLFCSGQLPIDPAVGKVVEGGIEAQTRQAMENLKAVLAAAGMDFSNLIRTGIFLEDLNDFKVVNEIYGSYFKGDFPARATVQVAKLPLAVKVEIEAVAGR